ncbi:hypothetical protein FJ366_02985 [Candidatus Dependentiae bacterium]|nr:hypothetical protein [Candidatus Dependentiae bacterium]
MTFTKNTIRMIVLATTLTGAVFAPNAQTERMQQQRMFNINYFRSLRDQAVVNIHHAAIDISERLNNGIEEITTTPEIPSTSAIAADKFIDFYFQTNRKHWYTKAPTYLLKWVGTGILPGFVAGGMKIFSKKPNPPRTLSEKISIAAYSALIYGVQEFILAKTGLSKVTTLTIGDFLDAVKKAAIEMDLKLTPQEVSAVASSVSQQFKKTSASDKQSETDDLKKQVAELEAQIAAMKSTERTAE